MKFESSKGGWAATLFFVRTSASEQKNEKTHLKCEFFTQTPMKSWQNEFYKCFWQKKKFYPLNFFLYNFFSWPTFFSKNCHDTNPETKNFTKKRTLNTEDVREKPNPNLFEKNRFEKKTAPRWPWTLDLSAITYSYTFDYITRLSNCWKYVELIALMNVIALITSKLYMRVCTPIRTYVRKIM